MPKTESERKKSQVSAEPHVACSRWSHAHNRAFAQALYAQVVIQTRSTAVVLEGSSRSSVGMDTYRTLDTLQQLHHYQGRTPSRRVATEAHHA
jgi:hypothetical protein